MNSDLKDYELDANNYKPNRLSQLTKLSGYVLFVVGFILPFIPREDETKLPFFTTILCFFLIGLFFLGLGEIIDILNKINKKIKD